MTTIAALILLLSAFSHASWNYLGKRRNPSSAFFLVASLATALLLLPVLFAYRHALQFFSMGIWLLVLSTGAFQALYYIGLAGAYRAGDLSVAYPLARALPVMFVAILSGFLQPGGQIGWYGYAGMGLVVTGCLLVPLPYWRGLRLAEFWNLCCAFAVLAAVGTTGYMLVDNAALQALRGLPQITWSVIGMSVFFLGLETASTAFWLGLWVGFSARERVAWRALCTNGWRGAAITGWIIAGTYSLVLVAMVFVRDVSLVAAFRQLSIPIGAAMAVVFQGEPLPSTKFAGIAMILTGLVLVGFA